MQILHLDLKPVGENYAELRYFFDNANQYQRRSLPLEAIAEVIELAETGYYSPHESIILRSRLSVDDYTLTGRKLFNWLDGSDRFLQQAINQYWREGIVLAIAASAKLAHLPWELLHDGKSLLLERLPGVVPVRWVASDTGKKLSVEPKPENRALNVLFMATSPLGVEPVLEFEREEARILEATARQPLSLTVEESGCLTELGYLVEDRGKGFFDILHLTGHATITGEGARFYTETETGELYPASARDIATELQFQLPKLIFLSGCRTGQAGDAGAVPSMAQELLQFGANLVLGWGQPVLDTDATAAAAALYQGLAAGKSVTEAVVLTYQALIKNKARDWHLLRLYVAETLPGGLVTPLRTPGRKQAPPPSVATQFLDAAGKVKVPTRTSFVGRRRQLQRCIRALIQSPNQEVGVLIHGMGGLGKSSLAARLCDRLRFSHNYEKPIFLFKQIDEGSLVNNLVKPLDNQSLREMLQATDSPLQYRLQDVLAQTAKQFLFVFDDFEANLEPRDGGYVLQPEAARVLEALVWAIQETYTLHRIIITCRYDFEFAALQDFYKQPMEGMRGADEEKKCNRLSAFGVNSKVDQALKVRGRTLADGNPRLLEWLDKVLLNLDPPQPPLKRGEQNTVAEILARLEADPVELREQVLTEALLEQIDKPLEEMLQRGLVFELPVPREAIAAVCESIPNLEQQINRAVALGLLEVSPDSSLRVPRILPLKLPEDAEALHKQAAEVLYRLWWEAAETSGEQGLEINRLARLGNAETIATETAVDLTRNGHQHSLFWEVVQLCKLNLEVTEDYRLLHQMALSEQQLGRFEQAQEHYQQALNICPQEDKQEKAAIIYNLATLKANQEDIKEAIALVKQSETIFESIGYDLGQAGALYLLGILEAKHGHIEEAITFHEKCDVIFDSIGGDQAKQGKAAALHCLGIHKATQGKVEEAIALYWDSVVLDESIGNVTGKAATLAELGELLASEKRDFAAALNCLQQSLDILQDIQSPKAEKVREAIARVQQMAEKRG